MDYMTYLSTTPNDMNARWKELLDGRFISTRFGLQSIELQPGAVSNPICWMIYDHTHLTDLVLARVNGEIMSCMNL